MKTILLQFWEESERGWGVKPDGASLHINKESFDEYLTEIYSSRDANNVPDEYDRPVGSSIEVEVDDEIYDVIVEDKNLRLPQYQLNNLIKLKNIVINNDYFTK